MSFEYHHSNYSLTKLDVNYLIFIEFFSGSIPTFQLLVNQSAANQGRNLSITKHHLVLHDDQITS